MQVTKSLPLESEGWHLIAYNLEYQFPNLSKSQFFRQYQILVEDLEDLHLILRQSQAPWIGNEDCFGHQYR